MRRAADFSTVVRNGSRARRGCLVVHHRAELHDGPAVVGFVVGKSVGSSVVRHRVTRRLRAVCADRLAGFPPGSGTVIRALPDAARASSAELGSDLDAALTRLVVPA